ncbi:unnamed protein product [Brachionus calyciflorus]|uniref:HD domain-containing protein n=1 Tax=Brachionus calyciflorus TaxID=104777 RepID=A0A813TEV5_9BILA|nr:unnamed protein product [Brachionus calyciflorus]
MTENFKIIKDSVHGLIDLKPIIVKIIDTPEFQRLRHLKQLESLSYIYPCAVHTRFEHSIGTSYLARQFIEHLQKNQPELNITRKEALCVEIAGLCHDLGHGPFSHLFEDLIKKVYTKRNPDASKNEIENFFVHEQASVLIFDRIFTNLESSPEFQEENLTSKDKELIKELINPTIVKEIANKYKNLANEKKSDTVKRGKAANKKKEKILSEKFGITIDKSFLFEVRK